MLLEPLSKAEFQTKYAYQRAVHLAGSPERFPDLGLSVTAEQVMSSKLLAGQPVKLSGGARSLSTKEPDEIRTELAKGATLILEDADRFSPALGCFIDRISEELCAPCRFNMYRSIPDKQGYRTHYDTHDFFILQLSGTKRWRVFPETVQWPLFHQKVHGTSPPPQESVYLECVLKAGDVLYVPKGHWHDAIAIGTDGSNEPSVHLTLAMFFRTGIDYLSWVVDELREDIVVRTTFPFIWASGGPPADEAVHALGYHVAQLRDHLRKLLEKDSLSASDFLSATLRNIRPHIPVEVISQDYSAFNPAALEVQNLKIERTSQPVLCLDLKDHLELHVANRVIDLDLRALTLMKAVLALESPSTFSELSQRADGLAPHQVSELLVMLTREGLLRFTDVRSR